MAATVTSYVPAFKAAVLEALLADSNLTQYQIQATYPGNTLRGTAVYYGKTITDNSLPVISSLGRIKRQEEIVIELHIDVSLGLSDITTAENTALAILGELDNMLAADASMGVVGTQNTTGVWKSYIRHWETRPYLDDTRQGFAIICTAQISVSARLA